MGEVWAVTHTVTRKKRALKFLVPYGRDDERMRKRFLAEARAAAAVDHPNVIDVDDVFTLDDGRLVMILDLLEGESLADRLARCGELDVGQTAAIVVPIANAVGAAHRAGIIHRDLKPANVFMANRGDKVVPVVLDFGIAKLLNDDPDMPATSTGHVIGTPRYMAPEQAFGEEVDRRIDIWALGVLTYECLTGMLPIEADNLRQFMKNLIDAAITPSQVVNPSVPTDVSDLVSRMLHRNKDKRPGPAEIVALLEPYCEELTPVDKHARASGRDSIAHARTEVSTDPTPPTRAAHTPPSGTSDAVAVSQDTTSGVGTEPPMKRPRWPLVAAAAAAAGVALFVLGAFDREPAKLPPATTSPKPSPAAAHPPSASTSAHAAAASTANSSASSAGGERPPAKEAAAQAPPATLPRVPAPRGGDASTTGGAAHSGTANKSGKTGLHESVPF